MAAPAATAANPGGGGEDAAAGEPAAEALWSAESAASVTIALRVVVAPARRWIPAGPDTGRAASPFRVSARLTTPSARAMGSDDPAGAGSGREAVPADGACPGALEIPRARTRIGDGPAVGSVLFARAATAPSTPTFPALPAAEETGLPADGVPGPEASETARRRTPGPVSAFACGRVEPDGASGRGDGAAGGFTAAGAAARRTGSGPAAPRRTMAGCSAPAEREDGRPAAATGDVAPPPLVPLEPGPAMA
jgi:hypothetical protein